jgi:hypothetical protein
VHVTLKAAVCKNSFYYSYGTWSNKRNYLRDSALRHKDKTGQVWAFHTRSFQPKEIEKHSFPQLLSITIGLTPSRPSGTANWGAYCFWRQIKSMIHGPLRLVVGEGEVQTLCSCCTECPSAFIHVQVLKEGT